MNGIAHRRWDENIVILSEVTRGFSGTESKDLSSAEARCAAVRIFPREWEAPEVPCRA
jgi:hypothetical protein